MRFIAVMGLGLLILIALIALLLRGCAPDPKISGSVSSTPVASKSEPTDKADEDSDTEDGVSADVDADSSDSDSKDEGKTAKSEAPEETVVKVKLKEKGAVAWIEVKLDGKVVLGKQVVGPFEQEFTVETQIDITTNTPSAVAVYKNGEKVRYDTKVSGVGKISILAPKKDEEEKVVDSDGDGTADMTIDEAEAAGVAIPEDVLAAAEQGTEEGSEQ